MKITTEMCKEFIKSISNVIGTHQDTVWKRTRKYKDGVKVMRDFESQFGRVTIAEIGGQLTLSSFVPNGGDSELIQVVGQGVNQSAVTFIKPGMMYLGRKPELSDLQTFIAECCKLDSDVIWANLESYKDEDEEKHERYYGDWQAALIPDNWKEHLDYNSDQFCFTVDEFKKYRRSEPFTYYNYSNNVRKTKRNPFPIEDIECIYWVFLPHSEDAHRIYIYYTKDQHLVLGYNDGD